MQDMMHEIESAFGHLEAMMLQESKYSCANVAARNPYRSSQRLTEFERNVNEQWRKQMCQWYFEVADCFDFDRGVVSTALNYLDRVVAMSVRDVSFTTNKELQLAAITALYIAFKLHGEMEPREGKQVRKKLTIDAFVILCRSQFDVPSIESMERTLLSILDWHLNPPDVRSYVAFMLELMPMRNLYLVEWRMMFDISRYVAELSLGESDFCFQVQPSVVACAAILCAINSLQNAGRSLPPVNVLEALSDNIAAATALRLDMPIVSQTAMRLKRLCPSIFVQSSSASSLERKRKAPLEEADDGVVAIEDIASTKPASTPLERKTSPVCVNSFDENLFHCQAGSFRNKKSY